jgi:hypothetical protein
VCRPLPKLNVDNTRGHTMKGEKQENYKDEKNINREKAEEESADRRTQLIHARRTAERATGTPERKKKGAIDMGTLPRDTACAAPTHNRKRTS